MPIRIPCLVASVLLASSSFAGTWQRTDVHDGSRVWTLEAEGLIEIAPDLSEVLRLEEGSELRVSSRGGGEELSLVVRAGADGLPLLEFADEASVERSEWIAQALRIAVLSYWASEPTESSRVIESAGGAAELEHRYHEFAGAWFRMRSRTQHASDFSARNWALTMEPVRGLDGPELEDADHLDIDDYSLALLSWLQAQATPEVLSRLDAAVWLAREAVSLARVPRPRGESPVEARRESLDLLRTVLDDSPDDPMLTLVFTWLVADQDPPRTRITPAVRRNLARSARPWPAGRLRPEDWLEHLLAVPSERRMTPVAWSDWVEGLRTWAEDDQQHTAFVQAAMTVAPAEHWAFRTLASELPWLLPSDRVTLVRSLALREHADAETIRACLAQLDRLAEPPVSWHDRDLKADAAVGTLLAAPPEEEVQALRAELSRRLAALTDPKPTPANTSAAAR